jgi:hypothetical protein
MLMRRSSSWSIGTGYVSLLLWQTSAYIAMVILQRCKHFEIGGDKKGKGAQLF